MRGKSQHLCPGPSRGVWDFHGTGANGSTPLSFCDPSCVYPRTFDPVVYAFTLGLGTRASREEASIARIAISISSHTRDSDPCDMLLWTQSASFRARVVWYLPEVDSWRNW